MAKLLAFYNLCPISDTKECLGVAKDAEPATIINTFGRNMAIVMKLSNQKQLNSWTVLDKFSSNVVYDFKKKNYVAVFSNRFIRCWALSEINLNRVKKIKFFRNIHNLYNVFNEQILVMYEDGTCESLDSALETRKMDKENPALLPPPGLSHSTIVSVSVLETNQSEYLLSYFRVNSQTGSVELNYVLLDNETLMPVEKARVIKIERLEPNVKLLGYTVADGNYHPSLITIWSDRRIFQEQLRYTGKQPEAGGGLGNFIAMLTVITTEQPLTMTAIGKDCVAIYAANPNLEGASLIIYNIQFKVVQARQFFKIFYSDSRLWTVDNNIFLAVGQQLSVIPFRVAREQLADMFGSSHKTEKNTISGTYVEMESINEDVDFEEGMRLDFEKEITEAQLMELAGTESEEEAGDDGAGAVTAELAKSQFVEKRHKQVTKAMEKVIVPPPKPFSCPYEVDAALRQLAQDGLMFEVIYDESLAPGAVQHKVFSSNSDDILTFSPDFEVLASQLERCGASEYEISEKLLQLLIQAQATEDIAVCLRRYNTISEKMLAKTLKFVMALPPAPAAPAEKTKKTKKKKTKDKAQDAEPHTDEKLDLLNLTLSCTFVPAAIVPHLRQEIDMSTALSLCNHLYNIATHNSDAVLYEMPENCETFDAERRACEWMMVLLDAHYSQFVLTRDAQVLDTLKVWRDHLARAMGGLNDLRTVQAQLDLLVRKKKIDKEKGRVNKWYSIESVQLY